MMKNPHRLLGVEMRHLAAFECVCETGSFAQAGRLLGYTQPAISLQVAALERAAGTRLLERPGGRRPVVPTEAGERMRRHAARIVAAVAAAEADLTALADGTAGLLRVGTYQSASVNILPGVMRRFVAEHPAIEVRLVEEAYDEALLNRLEHGRLDLSFVPLPIDGPFETVELMRDAYVFIAQAGSALAERGSIPTLNELGTLPLIAYGRSTYGIESELRARGIEPEIVFRTDESAALQALVGAGIGCAMVPLMTVTPDDPEIVVIDSPRRIAPRRIAIAWHRDAELSDPARAFVEIVRALCAGGIPVPRRPRPRSDSR